MIAWSSERLLGLIGKELQKAAASMLEPALQRQPQLIAPQIISLMNQVNLFQENARNCWAKGMTLSPQLAPTGKLFPCSDRL